MAMVSAASGDAVPVIMVAADLLHWKVCGVLAQLIYFLPLLRRLLQKTWYKSGIACAVE